MNDSCILVFTSRSVEQLTAQGGSQAWVLDPKRARGHRYVVCAWNSTGEYVQNSGARQHGEAYLVAPITSIEPAAPPEEANRYIIRFSSFARVAIPNVWPHGQRNPVFYTTLHDLGIDPDALDFTEAPPSVVPDHSRESLLALPPAPSGAVHALTIAAAKVGLAAHYGVAPDAIEIVIRG
jgi:hypothetical protein